MNKKVISVLLSVVLVSQIRVAPYVCASDAEGSYESQAEGIDVSSDLRLLGEWIGGTLMTVMSISFLAGFLSGGSKQQQPAQQQRQQPPNKPPNVKVPSRVLKSDNHVSSPTDNGPNSKVGGSAAINLFQRRKQALQQNECFSLLGIPLANNAHGKDYGSIDVCTARTGFAKKINLENVNEYFEGLIKKDNILGLCDSTTNLLKKETTLLNITGKVMVVGDIHGNLPALRYIVDLFLDELLRDNSLSILFLGDYVDRGENSLECISLIMDLKNTFPNNVFMLRGNHEVMVSSKEPNDFRRECAIKIATKYDVDFACNVYKNICKVFEHLPLAAVVNGKTFCVHGGIPQGGRVTFEQINGIIKPIAFNIIDSPGSLAHALLWNDPSDTPASKRKGAVCFSQQDVNTFSQATGCARILRAHEPVPGGCNTLYEGTPCEVVTINSVPRKSSRPGNIWHAAKIAVIDAANNITYMKFNQLNLVQKGFVQQKKAAS